MIKRLSFAVFVLLAHFLEMGSSCNHSFPLEIWTILPKRKSSKPLHILIRTISTLRKQLEIHIPRTRAITGRDRLRNNYFIEIHSSLINFLDWCSREIAHRLKEKFLASVEFRCAEVEVLHVVKIDTFVYFLVQLSKWTVEVVLWPKIGCRWRMGYDWSRYQCFQMVVEDQQPLIPLSWFQRSRILPIHIASVQIVI